MAGMIPSTFGEKHEGLDCLLVLDAYVGCPACIFEIAMFRADTGIVESGGDGIGIMNLAVSILKQVGLVAVKDADTSGGYACCMMSRRNALSRSLDADHFNAGVRP